MVKGSKTQKIIMDSQGEYLGMEKGCITLKNKEGIVQRFSLFENEIGEVILKSGNSVSTGFLASACFWGIDMAVTTNKGHVVGYLRSIDDDSHISTRLAQYEALKDGRALELAKNIVLCKIDGQNQVLRKYGLKQFDYLMVERIKVLKLDDLEKLRRKLSTYEAHYSEAYFQQVFSLFSKNVRPERRRTFKAYDGINNLFNLGYELLSWKVHKGIISAKLEPYLGFLHSEQFGKPSLVCDLMEIYRFMIDDFIIQYYDNLKSKDFIMKYDLSKLSKHKIGKRQFLNDDDTKVFLDRLNRYFEKKIEIPRMKVGKRQTFETLISEEALLLAKYLRHEKKDWIPRLTRL
jgi:CRISPR-associated protein Cas1